MSKRFVIQGGQPLSGVYPVQGSKNAALPCMAAALLTERPLTLTNVPAVCDVDSLAELIRFLGAEVEYRNGTMHLLGTGLTEAHRLPAHVLARLRGGVLLLAPLAARFGSISCALPGGCPIGRRTFDIHWDVFRSAGFEVTEHPNSVDLRKREEVASPCIYLRECSVTATENALLLFGALGRGRIDNPAREPHVFALVDLLRQMGCEVRTGPLSIEILRGPVVEGPEITFDVPPDYLDAGTLAIAAAATRGEVVLRGLGGLSSPHLIGIRDHLLRFGAVLEDADGGGLRVGVGAPRNPPLLTSGPWPLFPTDLVSLMVVLATRGAGICLIHDWMYESRMFFVDKLLRMGARAILCDPHRVLVDGPSPLRGIALESPDIRAGMALLVAGMCAEGETVIQHAEVIQRGYEQVVTRLRSVGANIAEQE